MSDISGFNVAGLVSLAALGMSLAWLSAAALVQGKAHAMPLWPDLEAVGKGKGTIQQVLGILSVLPMILTADGCHQCVMPIAAIKQPFSKRSLDSVMAVTLVR